MQQRPPRRRRPRPVADAPIDFLLLRGEELTKGWLLALIEQEPLGSAPTILGPELTRDGPRLCEAIVRALADDADLRRLEPGGALELLVSRTGELAGARSVEATARAIDALGAVIWSALRGALADPDPDQVMELAERLTFVIELVRGAALRRIAGEAPANPAPDQAPRADATGPLRAVEAGPAPGSAVPTPGSRSDTVSWPQTAAQSGTGREAGGTSRSPDALWIGAFEDEIRRAQRSGTPLSLLLIELEDADRVLAADGIQEASATFGRFAQAIRSVMRRQDILACETETRAWVIARDTARSGAHALAERIVSSVRNALWWRGAPLGVNVGLAVLGEDGRVAGELIESAEEAMFAAAASGLGLAEGAPPHEPEGPAGPRLVS